MARKDDGLNTRSGPFAQNDLFSPQMYFSLCCLFAMTRDRSPSKYLRENGDRQYFFVFFTRYDHTKDIKNLYAGGCIISKSDMKLGL